MTIVTDPDVHTYTTMEVCELTGFSYRQIDWWLRQNFISLSRIQLPGSGNYRRWTMDEVAAMMKYAARYRELLDAQEEFRSGRVWAQAIREAEADSAA